MPSKHNPRRRQIAKAKRRRPILPAAIPGAVITATILHNPFNPQERSIKQLPYTPGKTTHQYIQPLLMGLDDFVISRNGGQLTAEQSATDIPDPGDYIAVCPVIGGGGDDGKNPLAVVASLALMAFAPTWAGSLAGGDKVLAGLYTGLITGAGGLLISHLFPAAKPDTPAAPTQSYGWNQMEALTGQGYPLAITFGAVKTAGSILAQHVATRNNKQYLQLLLCGGEGPIDGISNIEIADNPIANIVGMDAPSIRLGTNDQSPIPAFSTVYVDQYFQYKLTDAWVTHTTEGDGGAGFEVTVEAPSGVCHFDDENNPQEAWVDIDVEWKMHNEPDTAWKNLFEELIITDCNWYVPLERNNGGESVGTSSGSSGGFGGGMMSGGDDGAGHAHDV